MKQTYVTRVHVIIKAYVMVLGMDLNALALPDLLDIPAEVKLMSVSIIHVDIMVHVIIQWDHIPAIVQALVSKVTNVKLT